MSSFRNCRSIFPFLLFRAYSRDFVVIAREHFELNKEELLFNSLKGTGVKIELDHLDLKQDTAYYIDKLEKIEIQSEMET